MANQTRPVDTAIAAIMYKNRLYTVLLTVRRSKQVAEILIAVILTMEKISNNHREGLDVRVSPLANSSHFPDT